MKRCFYAFGFTDKISAEVFPGGIFAKIMHAACYVQDSMLEQHSCSGY